MIEIEAVQPTAGELRGLRKGWGLLHIWAGVADIAPLLGLGVVSAVALTTGMPPEHRRTMLAVVLLTLTVFLAGRWLSRRTSRRMAHAAPGGGLHCDWRIDPEGLRFDTPISSGHLDWAAIKGVQEEADPFVFLVTPSNNPVLPRRLLSEQQLAELRTLIAEVTASGRLGRGVD